VWKRRTPYATPNVGAFLRTARQVFPAIDFKIGSAKHTIADLYELELITHDDQTRALINVLDEIGEEHYCGPNPPDHISKEPKCKGAVMFQFVWMSNCFGIEMCVKLAMVDHRLTLLRVHRAYNPNQYSRMDKEGML
jgi:hypothetical protein